MAFTPKELHGALFKADQKGNPAAPLYRGDAMIAGQRYRISAWLKDGQRGKYMSLAFTLDQQSRPDPPGA